MISAKFGQIRTIRFEVITSFVNFNRRPVDIDLRFSKFSFYRRIMSEVPYEAWNKIWWQSDLSILPELFKFVLKLKIQHGVGGHLVFHISFLASIVVAVGFILNTKFSEDWPYRSKVIGIIISHLNAWVWWFSIIFGMKKNSKFGLGSDQFSFRCENRFSGLAVPWFMKPHPPKN